MHMYLTPIASGTMFMRRTVALGVNPADIKPAYDNAPNRPAAPVPDDHVDTTFLSSNITC